MKKFVFFLFLSGMGMLIFNACKVEGPPGPDGKDGNANVKTMNITIESSKWSGGYSGYDALVDCPIITQSVIDSGAVMCYLKVDDMSLALPVSVWNESYTTHWFFASQLKQILFLTQDDDNYTLRPDKVTIKVVAIESSDLVQKANIDLKDYEAVKEAFHLKE